MNPLLADITLSDTLAWLWSNAWEWQTVYVTSMRSSLFTGFLTLASFLMAVAAFLLVNVKTHVIDKPSYLAEWKKEHPNEDPKEVYRPLANLASRFKRNIIFALSASISQFTVGLIPHPVAMLVCLLAAAWAFYHLFGTIGMFSSEVKVMVVWLQFDGHPRSEKRN